jgi:nucleotide-binding universal stress UspA family protein/quercetin dioxygenase-like cupin family protein
LGWSHLEDQIVPAIKTILHPTDFSENSRYAFRTACSLAHDMHASLIILHVMVPSSSPLLDVPPPDPLRPAESQGSLGSLPWPKVSDPQITVEHRVAEGEPVDEILRECKALRCDLVVMGTHGRTGLARMLTGSVAEGVLRSATCPVLVVKEGLEGKPAAASTATAVAWTPVEIHPDGAALASVQTRSLVRTSDLEVVRLIVRRGEHRHEHMSKGAVIAHCVEGRVAFSAAGRTHVLDSGNLLQLPAGELHSLEGLADISLVLLTILVPGKSHPSGDTTP